MTTAGIFAASFFLAMVSAPVWADESDMGQRVADLRAMTHEERKATIQAMTPEERQGIWFAVKQADRQERGLADAPGADGSYRDGGRALNLAEGAAVEGAQPQAVGTITYDDGVATLSFGGGAIVGNRFNTHDGGVPLMASGTVSTVIGVVVPGPSQTSSMAGFVLEGPQTTGGGALALFSTFTGGLTAATETVVFSGLGVSYTGSSFFVLFGDFANSYVPAMGTGSTNGQGHHGVVGYTGGMGPNITSTFDFGETLNGLVRASGNILPVELIEYGIE